MFTGGWLMSILLKVPKAVPITIIVVLSYVLAAALGLLIGLHTNTVKTVNRMNESIKVLEDTAEKLNKSDKKLNETQNNLRRWKSLTDDRFQEMDGTIRRIEHLMRIPTHARTDAAERYNEYTKSWEAMR
jgi:predicted PurR-regulated permease PerM